MPAASCTLPRQMFPPPTTTAIETPLRETSAICSAIACVVSTSTPVSSPANASPEIFSRTREKRGLAATIALFAQRVLGEAAHSDLFAQRTGRRVDQIADAERVVFDEG